MPSTNTFEGSNSARSADRETKTKPVFSILVNISTVAVWLPLTGRHGAQRSTA